MPNQLLLIKKELDAKVGTEIELTAFGTRNRKTTRRGILKETHHSVFVVELDEDTNAYSRVSYSYSDILTHAIDIAFVA